MNKSKLELLAPAKNLESGIAAINCGADAVYIGANTFGARISAGNSFSDIELLSNYAHKFNAKVYSTVNTIFTDSQTEDIRKTLINLYNSGVDAYIIQDLGILDLDIPQLPIFASTQMDNYKIERMKFFESLGIQRNILARELSLNQIREIHKVIKTELECFVYGALCVSYSGRCYMSFAVKGRSANRGECAQLCRLKYDLCDNKQKYIYKNKYLLSLKDLDLSAYLYDLINAGISSFKIEGRLKDINYVKNVTGFFRRKIDEILDGRQDFQKSSNGNIYLGFEPNLDKTFSRGKTAYFLNGRNKDISSINTPKSIGEEIGKVIKIQKNSIIIKFNNIEKKINNGDGLCYFDSSNELQGFLVNSSQGNEVFPNQMPDIKENTIIYRNQDQQFENILKSAKTERKLTVDLYINFSNTSLNICADNYFEKEYFLEKSPSNNQEQLITNIQKQFSKTGKTIFQVTNIQIDTFENPSYVSISKLNEIRRDFLEEYEKFLLKNYSRKIIERPLHIDKYFQKEINYQVNVANSLSRELYQLSGVKNIEPAFELQNDFEGKIVMTAKHCLKYEAGICPIYQKSDNNITEPLWLVGGGHRYKLEFDCKNCEMKIRF
jgi:putative protease